MCIRDRYQRRVRGHRTPSMSRATIRRRGPEREEEPLLEEPDDYAPDEDKHVKYKTQQKLENERKAKYVLYFTLVMWIGMILFIFSKVGESLYMAYLKKHGLLHEYTPYL
eukprot:TRINITY_DN18288_c0_g1_i2.p2 TRINITY_DN18288_c0_g1~~TRINITY_DN18288_c0_g1_i2.p2  ORF type:complete len:110 (+),score=42.15 TRINITY_DN18288_c0_g1_i2:164-493(+)